MRTAKARKWMIVWVLIGVAVGMVIAFTLRDRSILTRSRRVARTADWQKPDTPAYDWLSDQEVLFFRLQKQGRTAFFVPFRRNLVSGTETEAPVGRFSFAGYGDPSHTALSPDRQWMLWWNPGGGGTYVGRLDSTRTIHWRSWDQETHWLGDSRHCVSWRPYQRVGDWQVTIHSVQSPKAVQTFPRNAYPWIWTRNTVMFPSDHVISLAPNIKSPGMSVTVFDTSLTEGAQPIIRGVIQLPVDTFGLEEWRMSPQGDRVALLTVSHHTSPFLAFWQRLFPKLPKQTQETVRIWVSRLDGTDLHEVGHINVPAEENPSGNSTIYLYSVGALISGVRWLPNGKQLSFVYNDGLYTVPTD